MSKLIATLALYILLVLNGLASNWFVFGLWPRSWGAFALFGLFSITIVGLLGAVKADDEQ